MSKFTKKKLFKNFPVFLLGVLLIIASFLLGILFDKTIILRNQQQSTNITINQPSDEKLSDLQKKVLKDNYIFSIKWGVLGKRMVEDGVIDKTKFVQAVAGEDKLSKDLEKYFDNEENTIEVNSGNAQFWVDILWGLGLANKNPILDGGEMMAGKDASGFASVGGWTLGVAEDAMNYYSKYSYIPLSEEQQKKVEKIAAGIYRPCCGNSTAFPDCNHGMAMLGLIELMVSQGKSEDEIYKTALVLNTYWFPQTYLETALYLDKNGKDYSKTSAKELLSQKFSSAMRDEAISKATEGVTWPILENGGSCGA